MAGEPTLAIEAAILSKALKFAASIVKSAQTIPILANVRLQADEGADELEIVTTDLDIEFRQRLALSTPAQGAIATTVNARRISMIVAAFERGAQVVIEHGSAGLVVKAGRSRFTLPVLSTKDFPFLPVETLTDAVEFAPASALANQLDRVSWAASTSVTKYWLQGVCLHGEAGKVRLAAANEASMAIVTLEQAFPAGAADVIVPTAYAQTLWSLCNDRSDPVRLAWDERKIRAEIGSITLTGKLLEAKFPDYRRAIPEPGERIVFDADVARAAIRRVQMVTDSKTNGIKIERHDGRMVLTGSAPDCGESIEEVPAECGAGFATGINASHFSQMLEAIGGETIELHQQTAGAAALFRRVVDDGSLGIVMPMRV